MNVVDQIIPSPASVGGAVGGVVGRADGGDWAEQTRRVQTRDLLVRAAYAPSGEAQVLELRALHLNLPLVAEAAGRLGLTGEQLTEAEHVAMDGLLEAVRAFDPYGEPEFADVAASYVEQRLAAAVRVSPRTARATPR
jgi:DNA-directed RNA polymerase specialized sigma subunit